MSADLLNALFDAVEAKLKDKRERNYKLAVLCMISKRTGRRVPFPMAVKSHKEAVKFYSDKRGFGETLQIEFEEQLLWHALEEYGLTPKQTPIDS